MVHEYFSGEVYQDKYHFKNVQIFVIYSFMGFSIDTRTINDGDIFVALEGENFNGHDFIEKAFENGAKGAIVSENRDYNITEEQAKQLILVEDTLEALTEIAREKRQASDAVFIGITGSVGKTSTKEMLMHCLKATKQVYATKGNFNNHIGLPLCLANMPDNTKYAVFEIGMNNKGEIAELTEILQPDIAIVTAIAPAHMMNFKNLKEVAEEKSDIFKYAKTSIFPSDINELKTMLKKSSHCAQVITIEDKAFGLQNSSLVMSALNEVGLNGNADELRTFTLPKGRGQTIDLPNNITLIDDSYNASPDSMALAIKNLSTREGKKIAILGDMLELGDHSEKYHAELGPLIIEYGIDEVICVGEEINHLYSEIPMHMRGGYFWNIEDLISSINTESYKNSTILLKGSNGINLSKLIPILTEQKSQVA